MAVKDYKTFKKASDALREIMVFVDFDEGTYSWNGPSEWHVVYAPGASKWWIGVLDSDDVDSAYDEPAYVFRLADICTIANYKYRESCGKDPEDVFIDVFKGSVSRANRRWAKSVSDPDRIVNPPNPAELEVEAAPKSPFSWIDRCYGNSADYSGSDWEAEVAGSALRKMRKLAGVTQVELAEYMHTNQPHISEIESKVTRSGYFVNYLKYIEESDKAQERFAHDVDADFEFCRVRDATQADINPYLSAGLDAPDHRSRVDIIKSLPCTLPKLPLALRV